MKISCYIKSLGDLTKPLDGMDLLLAVFTRIYLRWWHILTVLILIVLKSATPFPGKLGASVNYSYEEDGIIERNNQDDFHIEEKILINKTNTNVTNQTQQHFLNMSFSSTVFIDSLWKLRRSVSSKFSVIRLLICSEIYCVFVCQTF